MTMLVDTAPAPCSFDAIRAALIDKGQDMALSIRIQREDIFTAMHQI